MKIIILVILNVLLCLNSIRGQPTVEAIQNFNGSSGASDAAVKLLHDKKGNVYVVGHSYDGIAAFITLSKFNTTGNLIWREFFQSQNNGQDGAVSAGIDSSGNIIIGGNTFGNNYNLLLLKYNQNGIRLWQRTYNGSGNSEDLLTSLAIDVDGNVYVAGKIFNKSKDIGLLKYDANGNLLWERFYNGSANADDAPGEMCLDINGNIYLTGETYTSEFYTKAITLKYSSSGSNPWTNIYQSGSGNSSCRSIDVDEEMNVVVTGYELISPNYNYLTIKYNSGGQLLWSKNFLLNPGQTYQCKGEKIRLDKSGNAYVTGTAFPILTEGNFYTGIITIKYNGSGDTIWTSKFQQGDFANRNLTSLLVTDADKIYVASYIVNYPFYNDLLLFRLNSNGVIQWQYTNENPGDDKLSDVISDSEGNIFAGGHSNKRGLDQIAIKFSDANIVQWESSYNSSGFGDDNFSAISADKDDNYIVSGHNVEENILIKYDRNLNLLWGKTFIDTADESGSKSSYIICDSSANIYASNIMSENGRINIRIFKFSNTGVLLWSTIYRSTGSSIIGPRSLAIDRNQNLVLMGYDYNTSSLDFKILVLKYSPDGALVLNKVHNNSTAQNSDRGEKMILDSKDYMYVIGSNGGEVLVLKLNQNGEQIWERIYGTGPYVKSLSNLTIDNAGNLYTTGYIGVQGQGYNYLILKYDNNGNQKWVRTYNGLRNSDDYALGVIADTSGNVFVTGEARNHVSNFSSSITTIKYDSSGNTLWMKNLNGLGSSSLSPSSLALDKFSNLYILNGYKGHLESSYLTVKYKSNGDSVWSFSYVSPDRVINHATSILLDNSDNVIISGKSYGINTSYDITTIKLSQLVGINPFSLSVPLAYNLFQNYPNPFNPKTIINYSILINVKGQTSNVKLIVYNALGKEVATLVNDKQNAGVYQVEFDGSNLPSGIYFYKLETRNGQAETFSETKRMILLK